MKSFRGSTAKLSYGYIIPPPDHNDYSHFIVFEGHVITDKNLWTRGKIPGYKR